MSKESLGVINWWGFTPAINFFENDLVENVKSSTDVNILLVGCGDSRHILKTVSSLYKIGHKNINFYVVENSMELIARQMLQMIIALIPLTQMGLQDKTELFLELYGNGLVREQSMDFVRHLANKLIKLITDPDECARVLPFISLDNLKFKERDILESIFKIWRAKNGKSFDMSLCWDLRVRQNLGVRYDAIPNVFDWDCSITLHDRGANIVNSREYNHWRHKGVAFQLRDANYDVSNRSLASGRVLQTAGGDKTVRLGYWGDIVCSPYLAFGVTSANESLFKKSNNQFTCGASRVSEYNISQIFYQISHNKPYVEQPIECSKSSNVLTITEVNEDEEEETNENVDNSISWHHLDDLMPLPNVKINFLPINAMSEYLTKKDKFHSLFDVVYFSSSLIGQLESCQSFHSILHHNASLVVETPKFIVNVNNEQIDRYITRIDEMAKAVGMEKRTHSAVSDMEKWGHIVYQICR